MDGDALHFVRGNFDLAGMQGAADLQAERLNRLGDACAQRTARAGPSKVARNPSPSDFTSLPRERASSRRTIL